MNMNITTLYKMQFQLLKPFSPRQEYALVVLLNDNVRDGDVAAMAEIIVRDYPHVARLYDAFAAANQYENAVPFIVPVLNSEEVTEEIFCIRDHALVVAPELRELLQQALSRVVMMRETPDDSLRKLCTNHKLAPKHRIRKLTRTEMIELCCDSFGTELPDDMDDVDPEAEAEVETKAESGKRPRKYPALVDDVNISYDTIRSILIRAKIPGTDHKGELHRGTKEARTIARKKILNSLKTAVDTGLLETLAAFTLEALACALTKMKDGDRYPRDVAYLKELIKHATR